MSCYNLLSAEIVGYDSVGNPQYKFLGTRYRADHPMQIPIPCGHCLGCRLDYSRRWADRMMLELDHYDGKAIFLTLTYNEESIKKHILYDDEGVPICYTLDKTDWQAFIKKLRSRKEFEERRIRFYAAGEYGPLHQRPHIHCIIFGVSLDDFKPLRLFKLNELKDPVYTSKYLEELWSYGFITLSNVSWRTCAYVSRYVMKKAIPTDNGFDESGRVPEFSLMSRRPGLGALYMQDHPEWKEYCQYWVPGCEDPIQMPKYFLNFLKKDDPELFKSIVADRQKYAKDKMLLDLQQTDLNLSDFLDRQYEKKYHTVVSLSRHSVEDFKEGDFL